MIGQTDPAPEPAEVPLPAAGSPRTTEPAPEPDAEYGGRGGLEPTRYGDWEKNGRCIDF